MRPAEWEESPHSPRPARVWRCPHPSRSLTGMCLCTLVCVCGCVCVGGGGGACVCANGQCLRCRCAILANDSVKCDTGVYKSLQAWKDHKLHIDHEVRHQVHITTTSEPHPNPHPFQPPSCSPTPPLTVPLPQNFTSILYFLYFTLDACVCVCVCIRSRPFRQRSRICVRSEVT